jgi:osmotically-inducible protein OsmY
MQSNGRFVWALRATLILLGLGLGGCEAAQNAAAGAGAYMEKVGQKMETKTEDTAITIAVKGALLKADDKLATRVKVSTGGGVVSLVGTVPTAGDKAKAEEIAAAQKGVQRVINAIEVGPDK